MTAPPVTFVSLAAELQQRLAQAAGELQQIDNMQMAQAAAAGPLAPVPLTARLVALGQALRALDVTRANAGFLAGFEACVREWNLANRVAEHMAPMVEQSATPLRRFALDLALHTGAIGNIGRDLEPLLQTLGQLLADRQKMLKHAEAQDHLRELFGQASEYAKRTRLLVDLSAGGGNLRTAVTSLLDAQKALVATLSRALPEAWAPWHQFALHFAQSIAERPSSARHHPSLPELHQRLVTLVDAATRQAEDVEKAKERAREQLLTIQKQVQAAKAWR